MTYPDHCPNCTWERTIICMLLAACTCNSAFVWVVCFFWFVGSLPVSWPYWCLTWNLSCRLEEPGAKYMYMMNSIIS